jgi:molybdate transport system ATP-binding protein
MPTVELDISVQRGEFTLRAQHTVKIDAITALFGASGSGKTTLLRVLAGLERGAQGTVVFDGTVWQSPTSYVAAHRRHVGYVFQDGRLFPHLTVRQNLEFAQRRAAARGANGRRVDFADAVTALDLEPLLARKPASLSGGEQQRVAIGRALLTSPRLLLMDEPLSSLDVGRKREIVPHIEKLPAAFGVPVLYVTHNVDEVARLATDVVLLSAGRIAAQGTVGDIFERIDLWTFTGGREAGAVLQVRVGAASNGMAALQLGEQTLQVPMAEPRLGAALRIRIHARDVAIATERPRHLSIRNVLDA